MTDVLLTASQNDTGWDDPIERIRLHIFHSLRSLHSRRAFQNGLDSFLSWCRSSGHSHFDQATVHSFAPISNRDNWRRPPTVADHRWLVAAPFGDFPFSR